MNKSTHITIVLRFSRNKFIARRQTEVAVIVNKNQIYEASLERSIEKPDSKGGLEIRPLVIPRAHANKYARTYSFFGKDRG